MLGCISKYSADSTGKGLSLLFDEPVLGDNLNQYCISATI